MKTYFRTYFLTYFENSPETYSWATFRRLLYFFGDFWSCGSRGPSQAQHINFVHSHFPQKILPKHQNGGPKMNSPERGFSVEILHRRKKSIHNGVLSSENSSASSGKKRGLVYTKNACFQGKEGKKHIHQRASQLFVGDLFAKHWCIDFGLLSTENLNFLKFPPISDFGVPIFSILGGKWSWYVGQRWKIAC